MFLSFFWEFRFKNWFILKNDDFIWNNYINVLKLLSVESEIFQLEFKVAKTKDINKTIGEVNLISSVYKESRMTWLMASCNSNTKCLTAVYDNTQGRIINCFIFSRYFRTGELIPSKTSILYSISLPLYEKKLGNILI